MSDQISQLEDTVKHLREVIAEKNKKLETRSLMLATLAPYLLNSLEHGNDVESYMLFEFFERHSDDLKKFKEEYGKEYPICKAASQA